MTTTANAAGFISFDDTRARALQPFALTRPASELRAGALLTRERWAQVTGSASSGFVGDHHLRTFEEGDAPPCVTGMIAAGTILVNSRCAPALDARLAPGASHWLCDGRVAAVRLAQALPVERLHDGSLDLDTLVPVGAASATIAGWWIDDVWDFIRHLQAMLAHDIPILGRGMDAAPSHLTVLGAHDCFVARGAYIEPMVLADTTAGPIYIAAGARISAFTRLVGPCAIGRDTLIAGGRVAGCAIGDHCRVHGEISASIVIGHANKSHDGFIGHSMLGRWSNLGAGTLTSNLKNSYGVVSMWTERGVSPTALQFLGTMFGDHAKTAIGTRFNTGTVIGAGANVFGSEMPPKFVPPFAWGDRTPFETFDADKFIEVAERVMSRRSVPLSDGQRTMLRAAWALGSTLRP